MQNMVYIKRHARSWRTSTGSLETSFEKNQKKFQKAFDKTKKCAILNLCHASVAIVSKNDGAEKSLKKNSNFAWQSEKVCYIKNSLPASLWSWQQDLKEKKYKRYSEVQASDVPWKIE